MIIHTTHEKVAEVMATVLGPEAVDAVMLAADRARKLSKVQEGDFLTETARFISHQYLRDLKPNGHAERLAEQLLAQLDVDNVLERRGRAAANLMSLAVLTRPSLEDGAHCVYDQIKMFHVWYENNIENRKEETDV